MLWYKAWLETRWRFLTGLVLLVAACGLVVLTHPLTENMRVEMPNLPGPLGEALREYLRLAETYDGYVWSQWFGKNLLNVWALFAVLIGVGGVVTESSRGTALLTLSLPATRARLLGTRAAVGAVELLALAVVPSLLIPPLSRLVGQSYAFGDALLYALGMFAGGVLFYGLSLLLSTVFSDQLKPIAVGVGLILAMGLVTLLSPRLAGYSVLGVMSGQQYFKTGTVPLAALAAYAALAAAAYFAALRVLERRDF